MKSKKNPKFHNFRDISNHPHSEQRLSGRSSLFSSRLGKKAISEEESFEESRFENKRALTKNLEKMEESVNNFGYFGDEITDHIKVRKAREPYYYHSHSVNFSIKHYFQFLFYHILTFAFLGPLINLHSLFFYKSRYLMKNLGMRSCSLLNLRQYFFWILTLYLLYLKYRYDSKLTDLVTFYNWYFMIIFNASIIASKYATYTKNNIKKLRRREEKDEDIRKHLMMQGWFRQTPEVIYEEIHSSLSRREIDEVLFKINFMSDLAPEVLESYNKIKEERNTFTDEIGKKYKDSKRNIEYYEGKILFEFLVRAFNKNYAKKIKIKLVVFVTLMVIIYDIGPGMIRLIFNQTITGEKIRLKIGFYAYIFVNALITLRIYVFFSAAVIDMSRKSFLLRQIGQMISAKKLPTYKEIKYLPTINLMDQLSLNSWVELRKLSMDYGKKYCLRHQFFFAFTFLSGFFNLLAALSLEFFNIGDDEETKTELKKFQVFMGFSFITSNIMFFTLLNIARKVNIEFDEHIEILKTNKQLYMDLLFFKHFYFFNNKVEDQDDDDECCFAYDSTSLAGKRSSSYVHMRLTKEVIDILGDQGGSKSVTKYLENLIYVNNACVEEIGDQQKFLSMKILGFYISSSTVTNLIVMFLSITVTAYEILYSGK